MQFRGHPENKHVLLDWLTPKHILECKCLKRDHYLIRACQIAMKLHDYFKYHFHGHTMLKGSKTHYVYVKNMSNKYVEVIFTEKSNHDNYMLCTVIVFFW